MSSTSDAVLDANYLHVAIRCILSKILRKLMKITNIKPFVSYAGYFIGNTIYLLGRRASKQYTTVVDAAGTTMLGRNKQEIFNYVAGRGGHWPSVLALRLW